jgi:hypothetical protein
MGVHSGSGKVFNWFANMTAVAGLLTWFGISFTYIRFYAGMKAQGIDRKTCRSPLASSLSRHGMLPSAASVICLVRAVVTTYSFLDIEKLSYTVQRLVGVSSVGMEHGQLCHKLSAPCDCSRYCIWPRSFWTRSPPSDRQRWISILDSPRSRQVLMMSPLRRISGSLLGSGW